MDWLSRHASEILVAVITASLIQLVDYLFAKRSKVFFFFTNAAQFQVGNAPTHTITLALWNSGRAVAEAVRVVHFHLPVHYQVWPPMATVTKVLPGGRWRYRDREKRQRQGDLPGRLPDQALGQVHHA